MDIEETRLPGVGLRHDLVTRDGGRLGVVSSRNGERQLVIYDPEDPDAAKASVALSADEGEVVAELLGAPKIVERLARLNEQLDVLTSVDLPLSPGSPYVGRTLGDTRTRTRTGASVVAVVRDTELHASPAPDFRFASGDHVVVVGTNKGVAQVERLLAEG